MSRLRDAGELMLSSRQQTKNFDVDTSYFLIFFALACRRHVHCQGHGVKVKTKRHSQLCEEQPLCHSASWCCLVIIIIIIIIIIVIIHGKVLLVWFSSQNTLHMSVRLSAMVRTLCTERMFIYRMSPQPNTTIITMSFYQRQATHEQDIQTMLLWPCDLDIDPMTLIYELT